MAQKKKFQITFSLAILFVILTSCSTENSQAPITAAGNADIIAQANELAKLTTQDKNGQIPLKRDDLDAINASVKGDAIASHYLEELYWLIDYNETEHAEHIIDFMGEYLQSGKKPICTPHELWHAALYVKHEDYQNLQHAIADSASSLPIWVRDSEMKSEKFPQFYLRLDEQIAEAQYYIEQLYQKNYSDDLIVRIDKFGERATC